MFSEILAPRLLRNRTSAAPSPLTSSSCTRRYRRRDFANFSVAGIRRSLFPLPRPTLISSWPRSRLTSEVVSAVTSSIRSPA